MLLSVTVVNAAVLICYRCYTFFIISNHVNLGQFKKYLLHPQLLTALAHVLCTCMIYIFSYYYGEMRKGSIGLHCFLGIFKLSHPATENGHTKLCSYNSAS